MSFAISRLSPDQIWPIDVQSTILVLQLLITTAGVVISFWIAKKYGEEAATKHMLREEKRHDHATLCTGQIPAIQACIQEPRMVMYCSGYSGEAPRSVSLDAFSYEASFMVQHVRSGYRETWKRIDEFVKAFNSLWDDSFRELKPVIESVSASAKRQGAMSNDRDMLHNAMAGVFTQAFRSNAPLQPAQVDSPNHRVMLGGNVVAWGPDSVDFSKIAHEVDREVSVHVIELANIWTRAQSLSAAREQLIEALHRIEVDVQHGITLAGWCDSGVKAGLENAGA